MLWSFEFVGSTTTTTEPVRDFIEKRPDPNQWEIPSNDKSQDDADGNKNVLTNSNDETKEPQEENSGLRITADNKDAAGAGTNNNNSSDDDQGEYKYEETDDDDKRYNYDNTNYGPIDFKEKLPEDQDRGDTRGVIPDLPKDDNAPDQFESTFKDFLRGRH